MANQAPKKEQQKEEKSDIPQLPFDDALRRILGAPPQHKTTKKPKKRGG